MILIKRLHIFLLKSFLPLFAMTFFIVLFIVLMQFLWRYIDDLVGKGLELGVLAELFFYASVSMVPTALPLAILLASLMTFGNLGEKFELTAMKAAGVSLLRTMSPLIVFISFVAVGAFFFQNNVLPKAQVKMWTLLFSVKQKSPELEIPEGVFYDRIPGFNLFIKDKDHNTGILHDVMIYDISKGYDKGTILLADSARLAFAGSGAYLYLHLWQGEQFDNLSDQQAPGQNAPFRRETFDDKQILIPFDNGFNRLDEQSMRKQYVGKNIAELQHTIDSVRHRVDSVGNVNSVFLLTRDYGGVRRGVSSKSKKPLPYRAVAMPGSVPHIDSLMSAAPRGKQEMILGQALRKAELNKADAQFKIEMMKEDMSTIRRHQIELMKKFTLSVACLLFFFIGAPLGAIIRKGGLGTPLVISVLIFIVYYIIDNSGYKLARDGKWPVWEGMWISTFILTPLGIYVTWKAMNDSAVFNPDAWRLLFNRITGRQLTRRIDFKEVIINDIDLSEALRLVKELADEAEGFSLRYGGRPQLFFSYWLRGMDTTAVSRIGGELDKAADYLSDSRDKAVVNKLLDLPVVRAQWVYRPATRMWQSVAAMMLFPVSIPVWIIGIIRQKRLLASMKLTQSTCKSLVYLLEKDEANAALG